MLNDLNRLLDNPSAAFVFYSAIVTIIYGSIALIGLHNGKKYKEQMRLKKLKGG